MAEYFSQPYPARAAIAWLRWPKGAAVEIRRHPRVVTLP